MRIPFNCLIRASIFLMILSLINLRWTCKTLKGLYLINIDSDLYSEYFQVWRNLQWGLLWSSSTQSLVRGTWGTQTCNALKAWYWCSKNLALHACLEDNQKHNIRVYLHKSVYCLLLITMIHFQENSILVLPVVSIYLLIRDLLKPLLTWSTPRTFPWPSPTYSTG